MSEINQNENRSPEDLDWLAFSYVANELSDSQRIQFESLLASDQRAREAVAQVMELTTDVSDVLDADARLPQFIRKSDVASEQSVPIRKAPKAKRSQSLHWGWQVAALLLVAVSVSVWIWTGRSQEPVVATTTAPSEELAVAWVDSLDDDDPVDLELETRDEFLFEEDEPARDWMLVALSELENSEWEVQN